jgi:hypothetical protein
VAICTAGVGIDATVLADAHDPFDNCATRVVDLILGYARFCTLTADFQLEGEAMKTLLLIGLLAGSTFLTTGCGTPGYTAEERNQQIGRNWSYEGGQLVDDFDHLFLLRPASHLTAWNIQTSDE